MAGTQVDVVPQPGRERVSAQLRRRPAVGLPAVIAVQGAALAVLAGLDGSPVWRPARVLAVIIVAALAAWFTGRARRAARGRPPWR